MSVGRIITQGGPGGSIIGIYTLVSASFWFPSYTIQDYVIVGALVALLFPLLIELTSDRAIQFIAYPIIKGAKAEIDEKIGDEHMYYGHEDKKDELTDLDDKVYRYTVLTYTGGVVAVTLPGQVYYFSDLSMTLPSLLISLLFFFLFSYMPYNKIKKIIESSPKLYD
ncbi:hypothetical protein [Haloferax gibbonsii]|uniref:hypothetical protein n=1 Tax=Haloferax gibbonsii TaxID=35746 RepID=UPI0012694C5C|nr:hypothetical protein [Haloferax gibbonsii]